MVDAITFLHVCFHVLVLGAMAAWVLSVFLIPGAYFNRAWVCCLGNAVWVEAIGAMGFNSSLGCKCQMRQGFFTVKIRQELLP